MHPERRGGDGLHDQESRCLIPLDGSTIAWILGDMRMPSMVYDLGESLVSKPMVSVEVPHGVEKPQGTRDTVPLAPTAERWWVKGGPGLILGVSHAGRRCAIEVEQTKLQGRCFGWSLGAL